MRRRQVRLEPQRRLVVRDRLRGPPGLLGQFIGQIVLAAGVFRLLPDGVLPEDEGAAVVLVPPHGEQAQAHGERAEHEPNRAGEHGLQAEDPEHDDRRQGQIHPALRQRLAHDGQEARRGREQEEVGRGHEPEAGPAPPPEPPGAGQRRQHPQRITRHGGELADEDFRPVVEHQRVRPERQPRIPDDPLEFRQRIMHPVRPRPQPDVPLAEPRADHQVGQQRPGEGEGHIIPPPPRPRGPERGRPKRPVVEQDEDRRGQHDLLRHHAQPAARGRHGGPARRAGRVHRPDEAIQGEQVAQAHQGLGPLAEVGDRAGEQRVHRPQQGHKHAERPCHRAVAPDAAGRAQRAAHHAQQQQGRADMDREVDRVVARHRRPGPGVVEGERQVQQRPAARGGAGRRQHRPEVRQVGEGGVFGDRRLVVEQQRHCQGVRVGQQDGAGEEAGREAGPPAPAGRRSGGARRRGGNGGHRAMVQLPPAT